MARKPRKAVAVVAVHPVPRSAAAPAPRAPAQAAHPAAASLRARNAITDRTRKPRKRGFFLRCFWGGLAFGLAVRSSCGDVARAGGYHPRGHACGDPLRKGREERPYFY